ncbi:hypothetical protein LTS15_010587 [Exophiala xenobiotica]|nr:hypothetical protein LTS15_010587 [Exophiala xenobiotica]
MSAGSSSDLLEKLRRLHEYSPCDVSDALLKLQKPKAGEVARAGFLADIVPVPPSQKLAADGSTAKKVIAPACTLKLVSKNSPPESTPPAENAIPKGSHWVDLTEPGSIVVIDQPEGQKCAAVGGIMAQRMKKRGVAGCIIGGRVRDMAELKSSQLPGDIVFCDLEEGIVVIPQELLDETLSLMPKLVTADDKVKEAVENGMTVADAFKKFRE